ncbi:hypothetical protein [Helicobacter sp. MIT 14-3879]|uniref:hypothetical protein n=1 Tax=Helicobacter sp. MIT 14-3879 TaxID=2040649 RepID=UPI000E1F33C2|nr:hypothetical protein [Helicobacter sp. MIT 14-3879]RDU65468.1 hypothetical protein CQA44_00295 [Helicobacter sp. MIT 14-3879]
MLSLGVDLLPEFAFGENKAFSIGGILGVGGAYMIYKDNILFNKVNKFGAIINVGFSFGFFHKHRIELLARWIPFDNINVNDIAKSMNINGSFAYNYYQLKVLGLISYSYTF